MSRTLLILSMAIILTGTTAQPVQIWLDTVAGCEGDTIEIALKTNDFYQVGSLTLYVNYDPIALSYDTTTQINLQLPGMLVNSISTGQHNIAFAWFTGTMTPSNIGAGTLAVMRFAILTENSWLNFSSQCEITNTVGQPLQTQFTGSLVVKKPVSITQQPQNCTAVPGGTAGFTVQSGEPGVIFKWQNSSDQILWSDLTDGQNYSGTSTNQLLISNVNSSFNDQWYRCRLLLGNCSDFSDAAILKIDTTQSLISQLPEYLFLRPYPNPFNDNITFSFKGISIKQGTFRINDLSGRLLLEKHFSETETALHEVRIYDLELPSGYYLSTIILKDHYNNLYKLKYPIISK